MKRDVIVAALCVAISVILYAALGSIEEPRATIFPRVVILAIGGLSMLLLGQALLSGSADTPSDKPQYPWGRFLLLFALIATYFAIMETVGFYVSAFLFYVAVCLIFGRAEFTPRQGLLWTFSAAGLVAVLFVLFRIILEVQTPRGILF
jgi:hypothetical protein